MVGDPELCLTAAALRAFATKGFLRARIRGDVPVGVVAVDSRSPCLGAGGETRAFVAGREGANWRVILETVKRGKRGNGRRKSVKQLSMRKDEESPHYIGRFFHFEEQV